MELIMLPGHRAENKAALAAATHEELVKIADLMIAFAIKVDVLWENADVFADYDTFHEDIENLIIDGPGDN